MGNRKSCDFDITTYMLYIFLHMSIIQIPRKRNIKMFISKKTINGSIRNYFHENLLTNLFYPSHIFISFRLKMCGSIIFFASKFLRTAPNVLLFYNLEIKLARMEAFKIVIIKDTRCVKCF